MFLASSSSRPIIFSPSTWTSPVGRLQADDRAHQHRLAGARSADHAEDLAAADVEVETLVDDLVAEAVPEAPDRDDRRLAHIQPIWEKKTANTASITITRKIAWTTAAVVRTDLLAVAFDQHALEAAGQRDDEAEHRRLDQPDPQVGIGTTSCSRWM